MSRMKTWLELFQIEAAKYPDPDGTTSITYSGSTVWTQWDFGQIAFQSVDKLDKLPLDPLTEINYGYSVTNTKKEYQLSWVMETDEYTTLNTTEANANTELWMLRIIGNYNGEIIKVQASWTTHVLAVPSIITSTGTDLLDIITNDKLAYDGYRNLPSNYSNNGTYKHLWETTNPNLVNSSDFVLYSWDLNDLATDTTKQQTLLTKLKNAYTWTDIVTDSSISRLANLDPNDATQQESVTRAVIYWSKKSLTSDSISIATTAVTYTWCLATTQDGHAIPQLSHLQTSSHTSTGTVTTESTTMITDTYRCNNWTIEDIWQTTSLSCNASYHDNNGTCDLDVISCTTTWWTWTQTWDWTAYGTCVETSCNGWYHMENSVCTDDTRTVNCDSSWTPSWATAVIVQETQTWSSGRPTTTACAYTCSAWTLISWNSCATPKTITSSLRFNDNDSAYLSRTTGTPTSATTWTWSGWIKRGNIDVATNRNTFFGAGNYPGSYEELYIENQHDTGKQYLTYYNDGGWANNGWIRTEMRLRDVSAWYHVVYTRQGWTIKIYVNGEEATTVVLTTINSSTHTINKSGQIQRVGSGERWRHYFDGYLADIHFIDWQVLTPADFGWFDAETGEWKAKNYTGTYGNNGFHLDFNNSSSLWNDTNWSNNWTVNNMDATDQMLDTPSNNFATLNPLHKHKGNAANLSEWNLKWSNVADTHTSWTIAVTSWKWYYEALSYWDNMFGVAVPNMWEQWDHPWQNNYAISCHQSARWYYNGTNSTSNAVSYVSWDIIGIAYDYSNNKIWMSKNWVWVWDPANNTWWFSIQSHMHGKPWVPAFRISNSTSQYSVVNFGQWWQSGLTYYSDAGGKFKYAPPTGYKALSTANLPTPTIKDGSKHFDVLTYTGNWSTQSISGLGFQPDLVWTKSRDTTHHHVLNDSVRTAGKALVSNSTSAESTSIDWQDFISFDNNGFSLGDYSDYNNSGSNFVAWNWKAGWAAVSNTDWSITSQVSVNPAAGFSVISYTGDWTNSTIGHGLSKAPELIISKNRTTNQSWNVWHSFLGTGLNKYLQLNSTCKVWEYWSNSQSTCYNNSNWNVVNQVNSSIWETMSNAPQNNSGDNYIAYAFHSVPGYSKVWSYTGNWSADGPFVYTGFKPRYVMVRRTDTVEQWHIQDSERSLSNPIDNTLYSNLSNAEYEGSVHNIDYLSNGFKIRTSNAGFNGLSGNYIYIAFADAPFKYATAR